MELRTTRTAAIVVRCFSLLLAYAWSGLVIGVVVGYHLAQPKQVIATVNGRSIYYAPPATTLAQRDHVSAEIINIAIVVCLLVATSELTYRLIRKRYRLGGFALGAAVSLAMFSVFGLVWGILAMCPISLFVLLSCLPINQGLDVASDSRGRMPDVRVGSA